MGNLATFLQTYRTALAASPASLNNMPENVDIADLPTSILHKGFKLSVASAPELRSMFGAGATAEYAVNVELEIHWDPDVDPEAIHDTIGDDLVNVMEVMLAADNRTTGVQKVGYNGVSEIARVTTDDIRATLEFEVIFRVSQDLS